MRVLFDPMWALGMLAFAGACASPPPPRAEHAPPPPPRPEAPLAVSTDPTAAPIPALALTPSLPPPPPAPDPTLKPIFNREVLALRLQAQERILGVGRAIEDARGAPTRGEPIPEAAPNVPAWKNGNALGHFVPLENEAAVERFHEALERLATGRDEDGKVRVLVYGASHTQGDLYTAYLRYYLQSRFGNGGPGFMQVAQLNEWYRKFDHKVENKGFRSEHAQKKNAPPEGRFGLLGASVVAQFPYAYARVAPIDTRNPELTANHYELFYSAEPKGGDLRFSINSEPPTRLTGSAEAPTARYHGVTRSGLGWHQVEIRPVGNGPVRVHGLAIERSLPGIVIDTLGINGTRAANILKWDEALWREHLERRAPELVVFAYGTNEAVDIGEPIQTYEANLREVLTRFRRALPSASCVLIGPGDFPREGDDGWRTRPRVPRIVEVQRRVSPEFGCAFWDTYRYMGGEGSMHAWVLARPQLGSPDHIHFTARGYVKLGMAFGDALMRAYDAFHLQADPLEPPPAKVPDLLVSREP